MGLLFLGTDLPIEEAMRWSMGEGGMICEVRSPTLVLSQVFQNSLNVANRDDSHNAF